MNLTIRPEQPADYRQVEELTREAFWNVYQPGCMEHYIVHTMRDTAAFLPTLDLVAAADGRIVGNIMYAKTEIVSPDQKRYPVITFGPLSVLPAYQSKGVGARLIRESSALAAASGHRATLICGDPAYYARFGFRPAEAYGIRNGEGFYAAALQALELFPGALGGISGRYLEGEAYETDPAGAEAFDRSFPPKEKRVTPSQARFLELVRMVHA